MISCDLLKRLLAHRLRKNCIGGVERVDAIDEVDVQLADIQFRDPPHTVEARAVLGFEIVAGLGHFATGKLTWACCVEVQRRDSVLANGLLIGFAEVGVALADDLAHAQLRQFLGHSVPRVEQPSFQVVLSCTKAVMTSFKSSRQTRLASGYWAHQTIDLEVELAAPR